MDLYGIECNVYNRRANLKVCPERIRWVARWRTGAMIFMSTCELDHRFVFANFSASINVSCNECKGTMS